MKGRLKVRLKVLRSSQSVDLVPETSEVAPGSKNPPQKTSIMLESGVDTADPLTLVVKVMDVPFAKMLATCQFLPVSLRYGAYINPGFPPVMSTSSNLSNTIVVAEPRVTELLSRVKERLLRAAKVAETVAVAVDVAAHAVVDQGAINRLRATPSRTIFGAYMCSSFRLCFKPLTSFCPSGSPPRKTPQHQLP